jgi:hypothetical protein
MSYRKKYAHVASNASTSARERALPSLVLGF